MLGILVACLQDFESGTAEVAIEKSRERTGAAGYHFDVGINGVLRNGWLAFYGAP